MTKYEMTTLEIGITCLHIDNFRGLGEVFAVLRTFA